MHCVQNCAHVCKFKLPPKKLSSWLEVHHIYLTMAGKSTAKVKIHDTLYVLWYLFHSLLCRI